MLLPNHGANPDQFVRAFGLKMKENSIDFSVNTNPFGFPQKIKEMWPNFLESIDKYPDPSCERLRTEIAIKENIATENILIGNGAAEIIFLLANVFREKKVLLVEPTFSEYRDACTVFKCEIYSVLLENKSWELDIERLLQALPLVDILFLCHPNNPTGVIYNKALLDVLLMEAAKLGVTVVIDEAFYDFSMEAITFVDSLAIYANLVIIRSLTKMYNIPGLRLGYVLASQQLIKQLKIFQPPWSVNQLAQEIGIVCVQDVEHVKKTATLVAEERIRIRSIVTDTGYEMSNSSVNFFLLSSVQMKTHTTEFISYLIERKIIPRHTNNFKGLDGKYVRLAIKQPEENNQLLDVLEGWKNQ